MPRPLTEADLAVMNYVAARIRRRREGLGLSQKDIATRVGVTSQQVSLWEKGQSPTTYRLYQLARALETTIGDLFPDDD